jgi:hypothetical protein
MRALGIVLSLAGAAASAAEVRPAEREFFENRIRPVLARECLHCHAGERAQGGLRLDYRGGWQAGGKSGPAVVRAEPDRSPLILALRHQAPAPAMPLGARKLSPEAITDFEQWVRMGAPDPRDAPPARAAGGKSWAETFAGRRQWWSLQPVVKPAAPAVKLASWPKEPIDRFILAKLEANALTPAPPADRATLLRRLSFVLTGLPPSPEDVEAFLAGRGPDAYRRQVERLLASPHFGERWARHWMDVVRYSDTYGYEWDIPAKGAWRYRDYLVRAFNQDVPFDQLIREQIAGDLLPRPRANRAAGVNESLIGPMFFQMGEKRHGDSLQFNGIHQEMLNDKIDAFSKAFQATTVACARCHDHKLDAVSQRDYYALAGIFMSSRWVANTLDLPERHAAQLPELRARRDALRDAVRSWWNSAVRQTARYLLAAEACLNNEPDAGSRAAGLDRARLDAWTRALTRLPGKPAPLEDPLHAWFALREGMAEGKPAPDVWRATAARYETERAQRLAANRRDYQEVAEFRRGIPDGWSADGVGLRAGHAATGDLAAAADGPHAVTGLLPAGLFTHTLSPRLNGALRSPFLHQFGRKYVSLQLAGGDFAAHRLVVDNAFLTERQTYLKSIEPRWATFSTSAAAKDNRGHTADEAAETRVYVEVATKTSNPNFPPRVGLGGKCDEDQARDPKSWFGIVRAVAHDTEHPPADELARFSALFAGEAPAGLEDAAQRYEAWLAGAVAAWAGSRAADEEVRLINWMIERGLLPNQAGDPAVRDAVAAYRAAEARLATPETVNGMADLDPGRDYRLNIRGVYEDLGDRVPRGYLEALQGRRELSPGSGRLALADLVASPANPLTARVFVNRVWHWVFGAGLVATTDDFGHLGERPSHPELLDYLAARFVEDGWSVKQLIRSLVLSATFQQSGETRDEARQADPLNRWLHHYPLRRLEAEAIRDSLLWVSGALDSRLFGEPLNPFRTQEDPEKRLFSGPLDGGGRRSLYIKMTIMEPPRFLATFNQPSPKIPAGRRDVTNVPAQALALLNDPFVAAQAERWARALVEQPHPSPEHRLRLMFRRAFLREPRPEELARWRRAVDDFAALDPAAPPMQSVAVWKDVAHAIFNTKEFLYVR